MPDVAPEDRVLTPAEAAAVLGLTVKDLYALEKETLNSREAADMLNVSPKTVGKWARDERIKCTWNEKHRLQVPAAEVQRLLREGGVA